MSLHLIDTTLREGAQFKYGNFTLVQKMHLIKLLDEFGVEFIELMNPLASTVHNDDIDTICKYKAEHNLKIKILLHIRLHEKDINAALAHQAIDGLNVAIGTSKLLTENSHGLTREQIAASAVPLLQMIRKTAPHLILRLSGEDSFRTSPENMKYFIQHVEKYVDRIGIPDTVGIASHREVCAVVNYIRMFSDIDLECHFHNDTDSAVSNAYEAWLCGAKYINTSVLGIGERNGITNFSGFIARLCSKHSSVLEKYNLKVLYDIDKYVAECIGFPIPFNNPISGEVAFNHKAGIHINALLKNPGTYQPLDPHMFGLESSIQYINPLMGWHSLHHYLKSNHNIEVSNDKAKELVILLKDEKMNIDQIVASLKNLNG